MENRRVEVPKQRVEHIVVGTPGDDCPICRAQRAGNDAEVLRLIGADPEEVEIVRTVSIDTIGAFLNMIMGDDSPPPSRGGWGGL